MNRKRFEHLVGRVRTLRHPCDLDLLLFFHRHPRALLTSERLAAYVGYDLTQVGRSLDVLTDAGLLERSQHPPHAARMYVLKAPESGWLASLLDIASTREGRRELMEAIRDWPSAHEPGKGSGHVDEVASTHLRATRVSAR